MKTVEFLNQPICVLNRGRILKTDGFKFGLELELEGRGVGLEDVATRGWGRHHDGSLRGEAIEFCTNGAKTFEEVQKLVTELFAKFKANKVKFNDSIRTSTHVHLNFSDKSVKQMINFFTLFTLLEEVLQHYSGEDRKGNLFCVSSREAEGIVGVLNRCVGTGDLSSFAGDRYKYAACNLSSLYKFGTVEIRTMKGATSAEQVNMWVSILNDMYEYACKKMTSPAALINELSHLGADGLMRSIFKPENYKDLMLHFPAVQNLHFSLLDGARILQVFAFSYDEDFTAEYEPPKPKAGKKGKALAVLPGIMPNGMHFYRVYRPDGMPWNCRRAGNADFHDGDTCHDNDFIKWDGERERFVWDNGIRAPFPLNWSRHHLWGDEGPPRNRVALHDLEVEEDGFDMVEGDDEF